MISEQIVKALAKWYLYHMPTFEHGKWTWEVYDMCMDIVYGPNRLTFDLMYDVHGVR